MLVLQDDREGGIVGVEFILGQGDHQGRLHAINMNPITISQQTARRFVLGKQGLWPGRRWKGKKGQPRQSVPVKDIKFANALGKGLIRFAKFVGAKTVDVSVIKPVGWRKHLKKVISEQLSVW